MRVFTIQYKSYLFIEIRFWQASPNKIKYYVQQKYKINAAIDQVNKVLKLRKNI